MMNLRRVCSFSIFLLLTFVMMFSNGLPIFAASPKRVHAISSKIDAPLNRTTLVASQTKNDLPTPWWWNGICDTNNYNPPDPNHSPASPLLSGSPPAPTNYRGVIACQPRPLGNINLDYAVRFTNAQGNAVGEGEYEWECVELSMRFMYLAYGIIPYNAPGGKDVVNNYAIYNNNPNLHSFSNSTQNQEPQAGDILSYAGTQKIPSGHTSVVMSAKYSTPGNGKLTVIEQNFSISGIQSLTLMNWTIGGGVTSWLHHTIDLNPQVITPSRTMDSNGSGYTPNEAVNIIYNNNNSNILLGTTTANSIGMISTTVTIPLSATLGTHTLQVVGQSSGFAPQTVFYATALPPPTLQVSPQSGPPTTPIVVTGMFYSANENVSINFDTTQIATATTNSNGSFSATVTVPDSALPGSHTIQATGQSSGLSAQITFLVQTNWPMFGFNSARTHYNPYENMLNLSNVPQLVQDWTAPLTPGGFSYNSSPAIVNGILYIGVSAFNAVTGAFLWSPNGTAEDTISSPAVVNGLMYVGGGG